LIKPIRLVVIVEECDKILSSFAVGTEELGFNFFTAFADDGKSRDIWLRFNNARNFAERRVVQSGINTNPSVVRVASVVPNELLIVASSPV
jgi:hypothetical protein